jgi:two-component system sensor histidine kinase VicK
LLDPDRIYQVLNNVLSNAIKYSPEETNINVWIKESIENVEIFVKDNGIGIPEQDLPRLFERFYRVDKARSREMGGTGLGLSIAKEIMDAHKGEIIIESQFTKGTTVILRLTKDM